MKAFLFYVFFFILCTEGYSQNKFNKLYRADSLQQLAVIYKSMKVIDNAIYTSGVGIIGDSLYYNSGLLAKFNLQGNVQYSKYLGRGLVVNEFGTDVLTSITNKRILLSGTNWDSSFSVLILNYNGDSILKKQYFPSSRDYLHGLPCSNIQISDNRFVIGINDSRRTGTRPVILTIDSLGKIIDSFKIEDNWTYVNPLQVNLSKSKKLSVMTLGFTGNFQRVEYKYATQLYEFDTLGNMQWRYETPTNRYVFGDGFVQLANGNYLMWGYEEFTKPDAANRYRLQDSVRVFVQEIKPNVGVVWNKYFGLPYRGAVYDLKILKDSSIVFVGQYLDPSNFFSLQGYLIKLNKNRDSIYRRNLVHPTFSHGFADYYPEKIDELDNGDLVIAGYAQDNKQGSPTQGQWGWLIRTDSMGCSLESTCRVPTNEVEKGPLSIKAFPNPANDIFTVEYELEKIQDAEIVVTDLLGRMVVRQSIDQDKGQYTWNVTGVTSGIYYVFVKNNGKIVWQTKAFILK
jgi:Secretion system C-terminal sorting domain